MPKGCQWHNPDESGTIAIQARTEKKDGEVSGVWIGGSCVKMSKGMIYID